MNFTAAADTSIETDTSEFCDVKVCISIYIYTSYIDLTARHLKNRVKEDIPTCVDRFLRLSEKDKEKKTVKILNAVKRLSIVEHLVNNQSCAENVFLDITITK